MRYTQKEILLKDGRTAVLRSPEVADAPQLLEYLRKTAEETDFLLRTPEECNLTLEQEENFIHRSLESDSSMVICCFVDGVLAGNCDFRPHTKIKNRHRANIGIALLRQFWGLGIGTAMFSEMIRLGKEQGFLQLELEVFEGNERAMSLYRKMGFETVAATPNAIRQKDGSFIKEYLMVRPL